jgi:hypothetical protein
VGGTQVAYVVLPWVAWWDASTNCTEPDAPTIPQVASPSTLASDAGAQLVSPLSQAQIATIVDPSLNGWFALNGAEINDNGCAPLGNGLDNATLGSAAYVLQRAFNNAGVIETDPNAPKCAAAVDLVPTFVVPSAVNQGDVVEFDGSKTDSTLIVPNAGYAWDFGDGTTATGPSVVHSYATGGTYSVKLTVTDRGGNVRSLTQTIVVLGADGLPVPPATTPTGTGPGGGTPGTGAPGGGQTNSPALQVRLQLLPQGLRSVLRLGVAVQVRSNQAANGITRVSISRATARRAHIKAGRGPSVVIGVGTVSGIKDGTVTLHLRLSRVMRTKLKHLRHLTLTVRLALVAAGGHHLAIVAAGRY